MSAFTKAEIKAFSRYVTRVTVKKGALVGSNGRLRFSVFKHDDGVDPRTYWATITVNVRSLWYGGVTITGEGDGGTIASAVNNAKRDFRRYVQDNLRDPMKQVRELDECLDMCDGKPPDKRTISRVRVDIY